LLAEEAEQDPKEGQVDLIEQKEVAKLATLSLSNDTYAIAFKALHNETFRSLNEDV